jgi:hypothetical protein
MASIDQLIEELSEGRTNVRFAHLVRICQEHFGCERVRGSHHIFKTPWAGDPRINLQKDGSKAKPYQVDQVIAALERLKAKKQTGSVEAISRSAEKGETHGAE